MAIRDLLSAWSIDDGAAVQELTLGNNNRTYAVTTPTRRYILRIYQRSAALAWVRYEHTLLTRLAQWGLPFAIPVPIVAHTGTTLLPVPDTDVTLAALFHRLPGQPPDGAALAQSRRCGAALAELDRALGQLTIPSPPTPCPPFGALAQVHPSVPNLFEMLEQVPLDPGQRAQLRRAIGDVVAALPALYRSLPQQLVHRDFDASNVLMTGDQVVGVLDFEFAGPDLRAFDLARSLSLFTSSPWSIPDGWRRVVAFSSGYREQLALTSGEIDALPELMQLYRTWSLIHREGRRRQGLASAGDVRARALGLLRQDAWLRTQRRELIGLLR